MPQDASIPDPLWLILALGLIRQFEGFVAHPYQDLGGVWTIGYGFTQGVTPKSPQITIEQAETLLKQGLIKLSERLDRECFEPLSNHQRAACLSLAWNIGIGAFSRSTLLARLNDGAYGDAASQFLVWTYDKGKSLPGLHNRREAEMACFKTYDGGPD